MSTLGKSSALSPKVWQHKTKARQYYEVQHSYSRQRMTGQKFVIQDDSSIFLFHLPKRLQILNLCISAIAHFICYEYTKDGLKQTWTKNETNSNFDLMGSFYTWVVVRERQTVGEREMERGGVGPGGI